MNNTILHVGSSEFEFNGLTLHENQYIDIQNLSIIGRSGSGVTYFLKHLSNQLPTKYNARCIIIDTNDEYISNFDKHPEWDSDNANIIDLSYRRGDTFIDILAPLYPDESNEEIAERVVNNIALDTKYGYRMEKHLYDAIITILCNNDPDPNNIFKLIDLLKNDKNPSSKRVADRLNHMLSDDSYFNPSRRKPISWIRGIAGTSIINIGNPYTFYNAKYHRILMRFLLDSIRYEYKNTIFPVVLVLDNYHLFHTNKCDNDIALFLDHTNNTNIYTWIGSKFINDIDDIRDYHDALYFYSGLPFYDDKSIDIACHNLNLYRSNENYIKYLNMISYCNRGEFACNICGDIGIICVDSEIK